MDPILKIDKVSLSFGKHKVLDNLNFEVNRGEIFGIIGPSGSGKTTLLNSLIGFYEPEQGDIKHKVEQKEEFKSVIKDISTIKRKFGFAAQVPSFYDKLTVNENLLYFSELYEVKKELIKENINAILRLIDLEPARKYLSGELSGGMKKRLDIGCAFIHSPNVLILDEPTADLDPFLRKQIWGLIKRINEKGRTVIISSHSLEELEFLCDRIAIIKDGKLVEVGTLKELKDNYNKGEEIHLESSPGDYDKIIKQLQKDMKSISKIENKGHKLIIYTTKSEVILRDILQILEKNKETLLGVEVSKPTLNEVFESIVSKK